MLRYERHHADGSSECFEAETVAMLAALVREVEAMQKRESFTARWMTRTEVGDAHQR